MKRGVIVAALACALALAAHVRSAVATQSRTAPRVAEVRLLRATRMLARWHVGIVDRKRNIVRRNTTAVCRGIGRWRTGGYRRLRCTIAYRRVHVHVVYVSLAGRGFEVRNRSVRRT